MEKICHVQTLQKSFVLPFVCVPSWLKSHYKNFFFLLFRDNFNFAVAVNFLMREREKLIKEKTGKELTHIFCETFLPV